MDVSTLILIKNIHTFLIWLQISPLLRCKLLTEINIFIIKKSFLISVGVTVWDGF